MDSDADPHSSVAANPPVGADPAMVSDLLLSSYDRFVPGISVASSCLILAHHILRLCTPKLNAVLDWFVTLLEICMVAYLTGFSTFMWKYISPTFSIILVARPIQLTALIISEIWATATIMKSQEKIILQHFEFLGGCIASDGPYSLSQILFNRSTRKPRSTGQIFVREVLPFPVSQAEWVGESGPNISMVVVCPIFTISDPKLIFTGKYGPFNPDDIHVAVNGDANDIAQYTEPTPILSGGHLFAALSWTQRQVMRICTSRTMPIGELSTVQPNTQYTGNYSFPSSTLSIVQVSPDPVKFIQEYTETSAIDGLATMGGFWTIVNGAFALFFGANVLYFLFGFNQFATAGRRPLSTLGIVHIFQRKKLVHNWYEDYPALRTEGGTPGSEGAVHADSCIQEVRLEDASLIPELSIKPLKRCKLA
ncbi:hypothetical protein B0H11DRAFT_1927177 [Mycena galericulata]|nr:hypothetical protein B0H11DRAFT_1927177 [Mycena galericulata]